jgi:Holliday junction resolvase RusA-like endonuclease
VYKPKKTTDREDNAKLQLEMQKVQKLNIETPVKITAYFTLESKRRRDLSNMRQSVEDILVKYGLLSDDDCKIIADLHLIYV